MGIESALSGGAYPWSLLLRQIIGDGGRCWDTPDVSTQPIGLSGVLPFHRPADYALLSGHA